MQRTVGTVDKIIRVVLGLILLAVAFAGPVGATAQVILIVLGAVALLTASTGLCPLYSLLGISTCKAKTKEGY